MGVTTGMIALNEGYVIGLLADAELAVPMLEREMAEGSRRDRAVDAELSAALKRLDGSKIAVERGEQQLGKLALEVSEGNQRTASLHQEVASLKRRSEDLKTEMERVGPGAIYQKLRRDRAKLQVQVEDRERELLALKTRIDTAREALQQADQGLVAERERMQAITRELDRLEQELPRPDLHMRLFTATAARAHCRFFLERQAPAWRRELRGAIETVVELHRALRAGKYRLDRHSDLVGGRATASAEALYAAVAIGEDGLARELFSLITDPSLYFVEIFSVFRVWCLGLYLHNQRNQLARLLQVHQWAPGLRGAYVEAFQGLLQKDARQLTTGLKNLARHEWEVWQDPRELRGAGVVNVGGLALARLARAQRVAFARSGPVAGSTIPDELLG